MPRGVKKDSKEGKKATNATKGIQATKAKRPYNRKAKATVVEQPVVNETVVSDLVEAVVVTPQTKCQNCAA